VTDQVSVWGVGVVSLATLDEVRAAGYAQRERVDRLAYEDADLAGRAEDRLADVGALLVPRRAWWPVPPDLEPRLQEADQLVARIARLQGGGWLSTRRRSRASARLRQVLLEVAHRGAEAGIGVPDVEPVLEEAMALQERSRQVRAALEAEAAALAQLDHEIALRDDAHRHLGFDALYLAAYIRAHGLPVVESPVTLARDEAAHLVLDAALAPPVPVAGPDAAAAAGPTLAHTGVQHWVGALRGGPAPVAGGQPVDTGALLVTSRRILFAGRAGSVSVPLDAMLAMDVYDDGLAVLQLGREAGDLFLVPDPRLAAFYANWVGEKG